MRLSIQTALASAALEPLEARLLLESVLACNHAQLAAHPEKLLSDEQQLAFTSLVERRIAGEPIAYLLGEREFYSISFASTNAALIPRPETELLVETALQHISPGRPVRVLDLGTGTGVVAITIGVHRPQALITAIDFSLPALSLARENAARLNANHISFLHSDWFSTLDDQLFDVIVSNPPYIAENDPHLTQGDLRFEPAIALASGSDGLDAIRHIVKTASPFLVSGGWLLLEHGYDQAQSCQLLLAQYGFTDIISCPDLAGILRVSMGRKPQHYD